MALLDLQTTGNRETIKIDDVEYHLTDFDDFSPVDQIKIARQSKRITSIFESDKGTPLTEGEVEDLEGLQNDLFEKIAGDIPGDVRGRLFPGMRIKIINAYFLAYAATIGDKAESEEMSQNGPQKPSLDSSDSTEETPKAG